MKMSQEVTFEQAIIANTKSLLKGIMAFGDISTAVKRWIAPASINVKY